VRVYVARIADLRVRAFGRFKRSVIEESAVKRASGTIGAAGLVFLGVCSWAGTGRAAQDGNGSTGGVSTTPPQAATATVTVGGTTSPTASAAPKKDEAKKPAEAAKKPAVRRFSGSQIFVQTSANLNTFFPAMQPTRNVTIDQSLWMLPRYTISDAFQLRGRLIFNYEFTNSDTTTTRNEPRFNDATVQLFYKKVPAFGGGFKLNPFVQVGIPLSPESQARSMLLAPGMGVQVSRGFEHVLGGELLLLTSATYSHPFYRYTTAGLNNPPPYAPQCLGGTGCTDQASGVANMSDSLSFVFLAAQEWGKWSPAAFFMLGNQWAYTFKDIPGVTRLEDRATFRQSTYFSAWLDYNANEWFTAEVGYFMGRNMLTAQGKVAGPEAWVFDKTQDNRVYLGVNVNLDNLAKVISGEASAGGVVRARNQRTGPLLGL
jgi:hypothetical protein